jgi:RHS repeat-associated protein
MPFGQVRYLPGTPAITNTDLGYTGQRELDPEMGLMDYKARFYSPYLNQFTQPDTIVSDPYNPQDWNRYAYARNNPVKYTDPSGHRPIEGCGDDGTRACYASGDEILDNLARDANFRAETDRNKCKAGNENYCSGWANGIVRPISGSHKGFSVTNDIFYGKYYYEQTDKLIDWKTGTIYTTKTIGSGTYLGTLNIGALESYAGSTFVFGIPLSATPDEVAMALGGPNKDSAFDVGIDIIPDILGANSGLGFSQDLDDDGKPITTSAGPMFAWETKVGAGISIIPFPVDGGFERGKSYTRVESVYQIPWWPFK